MCVAWLGRIRGPSQDRGLDKTRSVGIVTRCPKSLPSSTGLQTKGAREAECGSRDFQIGKFIFILNSLEILVIKK